MSVTYDLAANDWLGILFRLGSALVFGGVIGWERERRHKPAGLRTHMLVSLGSALFLVAILQVKGDSDSQNELSRVIQGVAAGVGFLGAGEILRQSQEDSKPQLDSKSVKVHGLTSAAAIWVSSALGIVAGCGLWQTGLIGVGLSFLVLRVFKTLEQRL